jgi:alpha,alpha-trehalose phosphorylase
LSFWPRRAPEDNAILRFPVTCRGQLIKMQYSRFQLDHDH